MHILRWLPLLLAFPLEAAQLSCDTAAIDSGFPRERTYGGTASLRLNDTSPYYAALSIMATPSPWPRADDITIESLTFSDQLGTPYRPAVPALHRDGWAAWYSPTTVPRGALVTVQISYRLTPSDGSTQQGRLTASKLYLSMMDGATMLPGAYTADANIDYGVKIPARSITYQTPNQHSFGDISTDSPGGIPLVLPAPPATGSLRADILWSGPTGTTMSRKIGSAATVDIPQGTNTSVNTAGQSLQLDLKASKTASPGAINGNLTLTLTCP